MFSSSLLQDLLKTCKNRVMLFNNNTRDVIKRAKQVKQLLLLVDEVTADNGGKPFTDEIFDVVKVLIPSISCF